MYITLLNCCCEFCTCFLVLVSVQNCCLCHAQLKLTQDCEQENVLQVTSCTTLHCITQYLFRSIPISGSKTFQFTRFSIFFQNATMLSEVLQVVGQKKFKKFTFATPTPPPWSRLTMTSTQVHGFFRNRTTLPTASVSPTSISHTHKVMGFFRTTHDINLQTHDR